IWNDTDGQLDAFVAGVGTGGTITGVGSVLKPRLPNLKVFAVEPTDSPVISGGQPGPHKIQGIGAGFIPDNLDRAIVDGVITVSNQQAFETARELARLEGIPGGISTGGNVAAALELAGRPEFKGKRIVTVACSFAERYISSALFEGVG
ncbi:MAG: pyridoxal-phosphate dependent enzyme, partial [Methylobacterium sp.]